MTETVILDIIQLSDIKIHVISLPTNDDKLWMTCAYEDNVCEYCVSR